MVRTMWEEQRQKELMANRAALMATTLGATGAVVTPTLRGQRMLDTMAVVRALDEAGVKTVLITEEEDDEDGAAPPLLVTAPEGVGIVSTGDGSAPGPVPTGRARHRGRADRARVVRGPAAAPRPLRHQPPERRLGVLPAGLRRLLRSAAGRAVVGDTAPAIP